MDTKVKTPLFSLNCNGKLKEFQSVAVLGILNATPDSFYDGGKHNNLNFAIEHAAKLISEGADIIDIGGASTRPNAAIVSPQEEMDRVVPIIEKLKDSFKEVVISIDTYYSQVAKAACHAGASIVNDISGGTIDATMFPFIAANKFPYVLSHIQGTPQNMQQNPQYEDVVLEVVKYLSIKIKELETLGVKDIIIDPGFGFGKTVKQNYSLLANIKLLEKTLNKPVLIGISRKSMLYKPLEITAQESLNATTAAHMIALQNGAKLLRVHDVKAAKEAIKIWELVNFN